jgi:hypothetical protein
MSLTATYPLNQTQRTIFSPSHPAKQLPLLTDSLFEPRSRNVTTQNNMTLDGQPIGIIIGCVIAFIAILAMLLWLVRRELTCCGGNQDPV